MAAASLDRSRSGRRSQQEALYRRIAARRGKKKAVLAVGHSILISAYHILTKCEPYRDLEPNSFDECNRQMLERRLVRLLEQFSTPSPSRPNQLPLNSYFHSSSRAQVI